MTEPAKEVVPAAPPAFLVPRTDLSITQSTPAQRVSSVLLNGHNFHAWSRSFLLYLGGKRKTGWILGKEPKPTASDPKVEHALTKMYAHAHCDSRIFELYRDISHASQAALGFSIADFFGYLQTRWEELAQYEPLSEFPIDAVVESKHLDRRHTYQFLMGLKPEFEAFRAQILNTSHMPSLYKAFATVDADERRRRLLPPTPSPELSPPVPDQMAFLAPLGPRSGNKDRGKWAPRTGVIAEVAPAPSISDYSQLQSQIAQLQSHLGLGPASSATISSASPTVTLATGIPTALHVKSGNPTWILDSGANNHMTGELSILSSPTTPVTQSVRIADGSSIKISSQGPDLEEDFCRGYECDVLYYFGDPPSSKVSSSSLQTFVLLVFDSSVFSIQTLDLWHAHLGHANIQYLCWLFPPLNKACTPSLPGPVEETPPEDRPLLPRPTPILEPPPVSSPSLTSRSLPPVITSDLFPYVPCCLRSNVPRRLRSHVPPPNSSPDSGTSPLPLAFDIAPPRYPPRDLMALQLSLGPSVANGVRIAAPALFSPPSTVALHFIHTWRHRYSDLETMSLLDELHQRRQHLRSSPLPQQIGHLMLLRAFNHHLKFDLKSSRHCARVSEPIIIGSPLDLYLA
ncbi:hypothetical protein HHK36_018556 [Tetracentron sinense]|uniref:Retrotransposon Copia-like N-terminal domain-containing protein n=1 Tax=Tetracentron sinense TaxID=13715 RepID=A0A834Z462_TETSI|nr:hypothetical protein HHK36_018556 [Tetracentron sinense]